MQANEFPKVATGDKIRFHPNGGRRWWTVRDCDERYVVATCQAPFEPKGTLWYTVVDLTGWQDLRYNGAGNGVVRSSLNTLGGGRRERSGRVSGYLWGLATLPIAAVVIFTLAVVVKGGYLLLGRLGKAGVVKFGRSGSDYRFRGGAVIAASNRIILVDKGTTGVVFFTGLARPSMGFGTVGIYDSALQKADRRIVDDYLPTAEADQ